MTSPRFLVGLAGRFAIALALALALALTACADPSVAEAGADEGLCARAAAHLAGCALDLPVPEPPTDETTACDKAAAATALATDCPVLRAQFDEAKTDSPLGALACRLGFYAACPIPVCPDERSAAAGAADESTATPGLRACTAALDAPDDCRLCAYYACRERVAHCGPDGYLVDYVGRYCRRFALVTEPRVSPAANAWLKRVRRCLAEWLETNVADDADCGTIDREGTDSHGLCYVSTGFCALTVEDWLAILHTIDAGDAPFRVMLTTAQGCLGEWLGTDGP